MRRQRAALAERWARRTERVRRTPPRAPRGNFVGVARTDTSFSDAPHPIRLLRSHRERPQRRGTTEKRNELATPSPAQTCTGEGPAHVRFGSKADICGATSHVRFTPNSDRKSGYLRFVMSALPPRADMCSALAHVRFGPKADIEEFGAHQRKTPGH